MIDEKERLRKLYKSKRARLSMDQKSQFSLEILYQFKVWLALRPQIMHFHIFLPMSHLHEVNTYIIKEFLDSSQRRVYTAVIGSGLEMQTVELEVETRYEPSKFGVPKPVFASEVSPEILEVVLVPLLAFDRSGNRIGFGKGYYDAFLHKLSPEVIKMGLSYFSPEEQIPNEGHDVQLNYCLTPTQIFEFEN